MSWVMILAADKPLPLCNRQEARTNTIKIGGKEHSISAVLGFQIIEHSYYRSCVDEFEYPLKPYQYEMDLYEDDTDFQHLRNYLQENFVPGETVELWNICLSDWEGKTCPSRRCGTLEEFDREAMGILFKYEECCLEITI